MPSLPRHIGKISLLTIDLTFLTMSFLVWAWLRRELGFFSETDITTLLIFSTLTNTLWLALFAFRGMYTVSYTKSRVDEFISVFKTVSIGLLIIFFVTFEGKIDLVSPPHLSRMFIINYWITLLLFVTTGRLIYRTIQKALLMRGIGHRKTLIIGWGKRSWELADKINKYPALGYKVIGFLSEKRVEEKAPCHYGDLPLLGEANEIEKILKTTKAQEIVLALKGSARKKVMDIMDLCSGAPVNFYIVPDLYDIVVGQARTNQIYGFPLIAIHPVVMPPWEQRTKRIFDVAISASILLFFSPLWLIVAIAIRIDSKGSILYKQERVGKDGKDFMIYKFRSMIQNAEEKSGPQWAQKSDPRVTRIGKWIRKLRIDEIPQLFNILKGEMSLIGPRPERRHFVEKFKQEIPFYTRRLRVKPGITGWAQIKSGYDASFDNVKTKLQYDLFYLENMSLRMDLKVIINTIYVMLMGKGQ